MTSVELKERDNKIKNLIEFFKEKEKESVKKVKEQKDFNLELDCFQHTLLIKKIIKKFDCKTKELIEIINSLNIEVVANLIHSYEINDKFILNKYCFYECSLYALEEAQFLYNTRISSKKFSADREKLVQSHIEKKANGYYSNNTKIRVPLNKTENQELLAKNIKDIITDKNAKAKENKIKEIIKQILPGGFLGKGSLAINNKLSTKELKKLLDSKKIYLESIDLINPLL